MFIRIMRLICSVLLVALLLTSPLLQSRKTYAASSGEYLLLDFCIVLDAGHGGDDGGAIGLTTGVHEAVINLSIVKKLKTLFEAAGATVILTRSDENDLCGGKYSKREDMEARSSIIEQANPYLVISVHCNSFPDSIGAHGAQMFFYPGSETGERLAKNIQASLLDYVDPNNKRQPDSEDFYMLRHGNSTNVMLEAGFLSNPKEEACLLDETYQSLLAYAVFDGTCDYIRSVLTPQNS